MPVRLVLLAAVAIIEPVQQCANCLLKSGLPGLVVPEEEIEPRRELLVEVSQAPEPLEVDPRDPQIRTSLRSKARSP